MEDYVKNCWIWRWQKSLNLKDDLKIFQIWKTTSKKSNLEDDPKNINFGIQPEKLLNVNRTTNFKFTRRPQNILHLEDDLQKKFLSVFVWIRSISSHIQKISLIPCFIIKIAMKKTFHLLFGRRPQLKKKFFKISFS